MNVAPPSTINSPVSRMQGRLTSDSQYRDVVVMRLFQATGES
jgi:hypothetical protein